MIHVVMGTRAEAIKMAPVILALENKNVDYTITGSGQHRIDTILSDFGIKKTVDYIMLPPEKGSVSKASVWRGIAFSTNVMKMIRKKLLEDRPTWLLYHGDTMTTAATAMGARAVLKRTWKMGHVEAGLRSNSLTEPFPEEISRRLVDRISDVLFAPTQHAAENLYKEGISKNVHITGNTSVDAVNLALKIAKNVDVPHDDFILVNIHLFENIKSRKRLGTIVRAILEVAQIFDGKIIWSMRNTTEKMLRKFKLWDRIEKEKKIIVSDWIPYIQFIKALSRAKLIITDSGSIQEESVTLRVPAIILRNRTERPEGLKTPYNYLVGTNVEKVVETVKQIIEEPPKWRGKNPYGDGKAGERIAKIILNKYS